MVCPHSEYLLVNKKKNTILTPAAWTDPEDRMLSRSQSQKSAVAGLHLHKRPRTDKSTDREEIDSWQLGVGVGVIVGASRFLYGLMKVFQD